ncbi:MAG: hypothetical protein QM572_19505 [Nocardioides sp.]|uniref:hypothetical protein n=1 Tax=Nocardioides sp. TaxID=35761 RepID=UPI0039E52B79
MRLVVVGGAMAGKSTLALELAAKEGLPVYCTDPARLARKVFPSVTYAPDGVTDLSNPHASSWVVENWLSKPGPWIVEGILTARALRKWYALDCPGTPCDAVIELTSVHAEATATAGQVSTHLAVATIFNQIRGRLEGDGVTVLPTASPK